MSTTVKNNFAKRVSVDGKTYTCNGERQIIDGNCMWIYKTKNGLDLDVVACADEFPNERSRYYHIAVFPGQGLAISDEVEPTPTGPNYLTFTAIVPNSKVGFEYWIGPDTIGGMDLENSFQYSTDGGETWDDYSIVVSASGQDIQYISLDNAGDRVMFKGVNETLTGIDPKDDSRVYVHCLTLGLFSTSGDVTSLLNGEGGDVPVPEHCFEMFFLGSCITTAPELPSTELASQCYNQMFEDCTSLTTAPELPATALEDYCYDSMFGCCTSLTTAPELPATELSPNCYRNMFYGCTGLTSAPELPATELAGDCYRYMFQDCTSLTTVPELPATTLADGCYIGMFQGCTVLHNVKCLATDISAKSCTEDWLLDVCYGGTFTKAAGMDDWTEGVSGIPANWVVVDA